MTSEKITCSQCGEKLEVGARFCEFCGNPVGEKNTGKKAIPKIHQSAGQSGKKAFTWKAELPLLTNAIIVRQLFFVLLFSSLCVLVFLLSVQAIDGNLTLTIALRYLLFTIITLGGLSLLAVLVMLVFYGNRYEYQFRVDEVGVLSETIGGTKKKNAVVNLLLVLSGKPGPAGAGLIGASRQSELVKWEKVDSLSTDAEKLEIALRRKGRTILLMRCTPENYQSVLQMSEDAIARRSR